ncbi:hypothetical protein TPHA_0A05320 [Tetrapisispora phaffii CBS 4417]|uniref:Uncharacterized protein n=1 Tax=Tetrapisispora phaffii (strain ATCC 24235 / CBS 4417 / NBRC 1672 / NRRL Y-8282 / UCD 70-5) TaxID=1071381 RepID=G8BNX8_TETPH|nr:hypothetical protein TPHA_0A05320 [Tetrapisispora phaffii CBS 4417]CCE61606.1 hypothetical protein TPHA_0A05320 [Tetrapisispora phaffii CBS 4417]
MSRAKEIQEKLDLQAKLQVSFSKTNEKVLEWLNPGKGEEEDDKIEKDGNELIDSRKAFFNLPLVQTGSGINFSTATNFESKPEDIYTIGDFINTEKKINTLAKQKSRSQRDSSGRGSIYRVAKDDTKAMVTLKRKMRQGNRNNRYENKNEPHNLKGNKNGYKAENKPQDQYCDNADDASDYSSDEEKMVAERSKKKSLNLLF